MYEEQQLVNDIWHYRHKPNGQWLPMSVKQINQKIKDLQTTIINLNKKIDGN